MQPNERRDSERAETDCPGDGTPLTPLPGPAGASFSSSASSASSLVVASRGTTLWMSDKMPGTQPHPHPTVAPITATATMRLRVRNFLSGFSELTL